MTRVTSSILLALTLAAATRFLPAAAAEPVVARKPDTLRTYRFTAKITKNGGVTPFEVGTKITGEFTYDLAARDRFPKNPEHGWYESPKNKITFSYGSLHFAGSGPVRVSTGYHFYTQTFGIGVFDLQLPKGWAFIPPPDGGKDVSRSFGIMLQNSTWPEPPPKVLASDAVPANLNVSHFGTRELRFNFFHGIRFPGGEVKRRAVLFARVEKLNLLPVAK